MSRTAKWEHRSDSIRERQQEARQARPAGRFKAEIDRQMAEHYAEIEDQSYDVMVDEEDAADGVLRCDRCGVFLSEGAFLEGGGVCADCEARERQAQDDREALYASWSDEDYG